MRLPTLFKQNRNNYYNYKPRYYDARKERIDNLIKAKEARLNEEKLNGPRRKKNFREEWETMKSMNKGGNSQLRFMIILIFLIFFAYAVIKYGKFDIFF